MKTNNDEVLDHIQAQLEELNRKIDTLIKQSSQKSASRKFDSSRDFDDRADKPLHKVVCADCGKACTVPFKPTGDRPVFCSECFSQQQGGGEQPRYGKKSKDFRASPRGKKPFFKKR